MNKECFGILLSFVFVFLILAIATIIQKRFRLTPEFSRKIIHIVVGNWVLFAYYFFSGWEMAVIVPASFIVINYLSYRFSIFQAMELDDKNPGTVYYSISLTLLTILTFYPAPPLRLPYLGIMAMVWGDGFAAVIGRSFPIRRLIHSKSLGGTMAFVLFTMAATIVYLIILLPEMSGGGIIKVAVTTAVFGAIIELVSPRHLDNLLVPLIIGLIATIAEKGLFL